MTIRNKLKQTISNSGGFGLIQIVSQLDIEVRASKDTKPPMGGL